MQIVIEIDEDYYAFIKNDVERGMDYKPCVIIANGTPLDEVLVEIKEEIGCIQWFGDDAFWEGLNAVNEIINKHIRKE